MIARIFLLYLLFLAIFSTNVFALSYSANQCFARVKSQSFDSAKKWGEKAANNHPKSYAAHLCLGIAENKMGMYPSAVSDFKKAVTLSKNKIESMISYGLMGEALQNSGDKKNAMGYDLKSLKLAKELNNKSFESSGYNNIANIYKNEGEFKKALIYFNKSLSFSPNKISMAATYGNMAIAYDKLDNYSEALAYQKKALELNKSMGNRYGVAEDLLNTGGTYSYLKKYNKAKAYILKGISEERKIGNKKWIGSGYGYLANLNLDEGNNDKALLYYKKAYSLYKSSGDASGANTCLFMINKIKKHTEPLTAKCAYDLNKHNYKLSLSVCRKAADNYPSKFYPRFLYGKAYMELKNYPMSLVEFKKAVPYAKNIENKQLIYNWIGGCYANMKSYKKGLEYLKKSLAIAEKINNSIDKINNLALIKYIYFIEKNYKKDIYYSKELASLLKNKRAIAFEYDEIGVSYYDLGKYSDSVKYDKKAMLINEEIKNYPAASLNILNMGHTYIDLKKYGSAKTALVKGLFMAKKTGDKFKTALAYLNLGYLYQNLNKSKKSIIYYSKAYNIYKAIKDRTEEKFCLSMIASIKNRSTR